MGRRYFSQPYGSRQQSADPESEDLSARDVLGLVLAERDRNDRNAQWEQQNAREQESHDARMLKEQADLEKEKAKNEYDANVAADAANGIRKIITINPASPSYDSDMAALATEHPHAFNDSDFVKVLNHKNEARQSFRDKFFPKDRGLTPEDEANFVDFDPTTGNPFYSDVKRDDIADASRIAIQKRNAEAAKAIGAVPTGFHVNEKGETTTAYGVPQPKDTQAELGRLVTARASASKELTDAERRLTAARLLAQPDLPWQDAATKQFFRKAAPGEKGVQESGKEGWVQIPEAAYKPYAEAVKLLGPGFDSKTLLPEFEKRFTETKNQHDTLDAQIAAITNTATKPTGTTPTKKQLDQSTAASILKEAGGDKQKARAIAAQRGYTF